MLSEKSNNTCPRLAFAARGRVVVFEVIAVKELEARKILAA
jgi:hypothetical protein